MLKERIAQTLRFLAPRDRDVIELRFGLRDGWAYTLEDVAHILGITRERVRQIEARAVQRFASLGAERAWLRSWNQRETSWQSRRPALAAHGPVIPNRGLTRLTPPNSCLACSCPSR